jgi:hypothetical protein
MVSFNPENQAAYLPWLARVKMLSAVSSDESRNAAMLGAPLTVRMMIEKGAPDVMVTADADYSSAVRAFVSTLGTSSVFFRMAQDNAMIRTPLRTRIGLIAADATAWIVGEGSPVPLSRLELSTSVLEPVRCAALIVATKELLRTVTASGQQVFNFHLKLSLSAVVDDYFLQLLVDGTDTPTIASSGDTSDDVMADMRALLLALPRSSLTLYLAVAPDVAKRASTFPALFPAMSATGGEMVNLPAVVSASVAAGTILLIDARAIGADTDTIELKTSNEANIEMLDDQNVASTINLFESNSSALMATAHFGVEKLRPDACAVLESVNWGGDVTA